ncbi:: VanZ [Gemmataceae bacterium]|nr:: VanZ [Gemmataceae bacterium]VTU00848.1 : VanZ [Gemmataceae bacterium]
MTRTALPTAVFLTFLGLWTWKLLEPSPVPEAVGEVIPTDLKFIASKCAHLGGYTFLTILAAWLPLRRRGFWGVVALLALHGVLSEVLQHALGWGRTGKWTDVLIDWAGIALGVLVLRVWASGGRLSPPTQSELPGSP